MKLPAHLPVHRVDMSGRAGRAPGLVQALALGLLAATLVMPAGAAGIDTHGTHTLPNGVQHSEQTYTLPAVKVTGTDGRRLSLAEALDDGRPVLLNFIYTSCNAVCPVTSQVFVEVRERLGAERDKVNMVSISIDPEQDTPRRLAAYARRFGSAGTWAHYTSSSADAFEIQRTFGAWRGDKMNHQPVTWLRSAPGKAWHRYDGLARPEQLVGDYLALVSGAELCLEPAPATTPAAGLSARGR